MTTGSLQIDTEEQMRQVPKMKTAVFIDHFSGSDSNRSSVFVSIE